MADIHCLVCNEPWDSYGARHGDMLTWEYNLMRLGSGCPCCQGGEPRGDLEKLADVNSGRPVDAPPWTPPPHKTLWTCAGCEVSAVYSYEDEERTWVGGKSVHYRSGLAYSYPLITEDEEIPSEPPHHIGTSFYCAGCATGCARCDASIFTRQEMEGDAYDPGSAFLPEGEYRVGSTVCINCYENSLASEEDE